MNKLSNVLTTAQNHLSGYQHFTDIIDDFKDLTQYSQQVDDTTTDNSPADDSPTD